MRHHLIVARMEVGEGFYLALEQGDSRHVLSAGASAEGTAKTALKMLRDEPGQHFSFTTRRPREMAVAPLLMNAEDLLQAAPGASITLMACEGRAHDISMWTALWRTPNGHISWRGVEDRFKEQSLADQIEKWFLRESYTSFRPERPSERGPHNRVSRPPFPRELLARHDFNLRASLPAVFPAQQGAALATAR